MTGLSLRQLSATPTGRGWFWTGCSNTNVVVVVAVAVVVVVEFSWLVVDRICHVASGLISNHSCCFCDGATAADEGGVLFVLLWSSLLSLDSRSVMISVREGSEGSHFCQTRAPFGVKPN